MAKYKGCYMGTVQARDVGKPFFFIKRFDLPVGLGWGKVMPIDVGKEIYMHNRQISIENTDQMLARLADSNSVTAGT